MFSIIFKSKINMKLKKTNVAVLKQKIAIMVQLMINMPYKIIIRFSLSTNDPISAVHCCIDYIIVYVKTLNVISAK